MSERKFNPCPKRAVVLRDLVAEHGWQIGAELGVFWGETFFYLLNTFPELILIGVDTWEWGPEQPDGEDGFRSYRQFPLNAYEADVKRRARSYGNRAVIYKMRTVEAARCLPDESLDFVFIDADHTLAAVRTDIRAWAPKVKKDGWLVGHDVHFPSVLLAVTELLSGWQEFNNFIWAVPRARTAFA